MRARIFVPLSVKIYSISLLMLTLLVIVASGNYLRMTVIKEEVKDVAEFITPITKSVTEIYTHVLEQEVAFERMLRLIQEKPENREAIARQKQALFALGENIQQEIQSTKTLSELAAKGSELHEDIITLAQLSPELRMLAEDHQQFSAMYQSIVLAMMQKEQSKARLLDEQLERLEDIFNLRIQRLQNQLAEVTQSSVNKIQNQDEALLTFNVALSIIASIVGILLAGVFAKRIVKPLRDLISGSDALLKENYQHQIAQASHDEIGELTQSYNRLMQSVNKKETLRASMQEYLDPRVVRLLSEHPEQLKGARQQASVLFSDIAKFSKLSEILSPESLVAVINEYYNLAGNAILQLDGVVDKYIGDAIVAFWSPPFNEPGSIARLACRGALKQMEQLNHLRLLLPDLVGIRKGLPEIDIRIGIATDDVVVGNIGTRQSRSFTIIGPAVTVAEQLEQMNKKLGTNILVTAATKSMAGSEFLFRLAGKLTPEVNHQASETSEVYALLGYKEAFSQQQIQAFALCDQAIVKLWQGDTTEAAEQLHEFLQLQANDSIALHYKALAQDPKFALSPGN